MEQEAFRQGKLEQAVDAVETGIVELKADVRHLFDEFHYSRVAQGERIGSVEKEQVKLRAEFSAALRNAAWIVGLIQSVGLLILGGLLTWASR